MCPSVTSLAFLITVYTAMLLFCHTLPYLNSPSHRNVSSLSAIMDLSGNFWKLSKRMKGRTVNVVQIQLCDFDNGIWDLIRFCPMNVQ